MSTVGLVGTARRSEEGEFCLLQPFLGILECWVNRLADRGNAFAAVQSSQLDFGTTEM